MYHVALGEFGGTMDAVGAIVGGVTNMAGSIATAAGTAKSSKEMTKQAAIGLEAAKVNFASQTLALQQQEMQLRMATVTATTSKKGLPGWAWMLIALGGVGAVGGVGLYVYSKK